MLKHHRMRFPLIYVEKYLIVWIARERQILQKVVLDQQKTTFIFF